MPVAAPLEWEEGAIQMMTKCAHHPVRSGLHSACNWEAALFVAAYTQSESRGCPVVRSSRTGLSGQTQPRSGRAVLCCKLFVWLVTQLRHIHT